MEEKRIAYIASVKEREQQLKIVIEKIITQVDLIHLVLNYYKEIPNWLKDDPKIFCHVNSENKHAHDSVWQYVDAEGVVEQMCGVSSYNLIMDDDLDYPKDYVSKMIRAIENSQNRRSMVVTVHGAKFSQPIRDYFKDKITYGFCDMLLDNVNVDLAGVGTVAFHSSTIRPTLQDFPIPFCRDLLFSILCKKNNVSIMAVKRSVNWITPLEILGDTVYEATKRSKNLQFFKNNLLKEVLAPLLYCDMRHPEFCLMTDYDYDERLVHNTLKTLFRVSSCNKIIFTDGVKNISHETWGLEQFVIPEEREIGIAGSKIVTQFRFMAGLPDGSKVLSADCDLHFVKNPFVAFKQEFDIAVTTRCEAHHYPINQGVVMFRINDKVRNFLQFLSSQINERTWPELIKFQKAFNHTGNDWNVGQDMMCVAWLRKDWVLEKFGVKIIDIGSDFNFCPHADGIHTYSGQAKLIDAYRAKDKTILHLKSKLRELLFNREIE